MKKANSKAHLQTSSNGNQSQVGMSPAQAKPHSMIKLYRGHTQNQNAVPKTNVNFQPTAIIAKNIESRRQYQYKNATSNNITLNQLQEGNNNNSVQAVKPSSIFSPGDTVNRKNDTMDMRKNIKSDKQSPDLRQRLFQKSNQIKNHNNDGCVNIRNQIEKQRSLKSLFNNTQKLTSTSNSRLMQPKSSRNTNGQRLQPSGSERALVRRGAQYSTNPANQGFNHTTIQDMLKKNNSQSNLNYLGRNRSGYLNFNSTQPIGNKNKKLIDLTQCSRGQVDLVSNDNFFVEQVQNKMLHNQSPSVSSDDNDDEKENQNSVQRFKSTVPMSQKFNLSHQKKASQVPNGSFIETKMKNCLQSRNNDQVAQVDKTHRDQNPLSKNKSQPFLHQGQKVNNLTYRNNFVKTSFLRNDPSRSVTPVTGGQKSSKSPYCYSTKDDKFSTKSQSKKIANHQGDMKSLNLSPIIPQNLSKNQLNFLKGTKSGDNTRKNAASAKKHLEMRKQSAKSTTNNANAQNYNSLKKTKPPANSKKQKQDETTTEKKNRNKAFKQQKQGTRKAYGSQETERVHGATNSYSTTDEMNLKSNDQIQPQNQLRLKVLQQKEPTTLKSNIQFAQMASIQDEKEFKYLSLWNKDQESKIKMTQILNNNKIANQNRYDLNKTHDQLIIADKNNDPVQCENIKTPKANCNKCEDTVMLNDPWRFAKDEEQTAKKKSSEHHKMTTSDIVDEEEIDSKDFEEFDEAESSGKSSSSLKVRIIDQQETFNKLIQQKHILSKYNSEAQNFSKCQQQQEDRNSLVNYDTSLLTNNTGRDRNSSLIYDAREGVQRKTRQLNAHPKVSEYTKRDGDVKNKNRDKTFVLADSMNRIKE